jgi:hypothetical protein
MLIIYEASFSRNGILDAYNLKWHIPIQYSSVQMSAAVHNIWASIFESCFASCHFLEDTLPELLDTVTLDIWWSISYIHDGTWSKFSLRLPTRWEGYGDSDQYPGQVVHQIWIPLILPMGTSKRFSYYEHMYFGRGTAHCIQNGYMSVCNTHGIFQHICQPMHHAEVYMVMEDQHLEHVL